MQPLECVCAHVHLCVGVYIVYRVSHLGFINQTDLFEGIDVHSCLVYIGTR